MTETEKRKKIIQRRIDMDLLKRSVSGVFIYAILLPVIFYFYDFYQAEPQISWSITLAMVVISVFRAIHYLQTKQLYIYSPKIWYLTFSALSLGQAIILGITFALAVAEPRFSLITHAMFLAVGGLAGGALTALMPRLRLALINLFFLLIPGVLVALSTEGHAGFAVLLMIYFSYLFILGVRINREYLRAFDIEYQLQLQRAELEQLNKVDPLTHIYNRGHFNTAYEHQWNNAIRSQHQRQYQHQQSLLLIDVDKFKVINDSHGHLLGDECLIFIAKIIHDTAQRKTDVIARFGGEEFAVLLSDTPLEEAVSLAEAIREKIASQPFTQKETTLTITVSIGVASIVPQSSINSNQLIETADKYLYQAKNDGRNKVCYKDE